MDDNIYAVVKRYGENFEEWCFKPNDDDGIYNRMIELTSGDMEITIDACAWCELASVGEIYEFREGEIEIMEID